MRRFVSVILALVLSVVVGFSAPSALATHVSYPTPTCSPPNGDPDNGYPSSFIGKKVSKPGVIYAQSDVGFMNLRGSSQGPNDPIDGSAWAMVTTTDGFFQLGILARSATQPPYYFAAWGTNDLGGPTGRYCEYNLGPVGPYSHIYSAAYNPAYPDHELRATIDGSLC